MQLDQAAVRDPASRPAAQQLRIDLDGRNLATDQILPARCGLIRSGGHADRHEPAGPEADLCTHLCTGHGGTG